LAYYMGKNTPERQDFIIDNLRVELDAVEDGNDPDKKVALVEDETESTVEG
jgi:hypothetical protein